MQTKSVGIALYPVRCANAVGGPGRGHQGRTRGRRAGRDLHECRGEKSVLTPRRAAAVIYNTYMQMSPGETSLEHSCCGGQQGCRLSCCRLHFCGWARRSVQTRRFTAILSIDKATGRTQISPSSIHLSTCAVGRRIHERAQGAVRRAAALLPAAGDGGESAARRRACPQVPSPHRQGALRGHRPAEHRCSRDFLSWISPLHFFLLSNGAPWPIQRNRTA